jgi:hypothetical protein
LDKGGGEVRVPHEACAGVEELEEGVIVVVRAFKDEALAYTGPERTRLLVHVVSEGFVFILPGEVIAVRDVRNVQL